MPSIDILVPLFFLLFSLGYRLFENHRPVFFWSFFRLLIVVLLVHFAFVGYVWQWLFLYATIAILIVLSIKTLAINETTDGVSRGRRRLWGTAVTLTTLAFILIWVFPIRSLPEPTGDLATGTLSWVIETDREEAYTEAPGDLRRFKVQVWYPATVSETDVPAKWLIDGRQTSRGLASDFGFPGFIFDHLANVEAYSYVDAEPDAGTYPVAIISHGWTGFRNLHTDLAEELASHGYIVFGTNHAYGSVATVFADGDFAPLNDDALPPRETTDDYLTYANQLIGTFSADIIDLLDALETLNSDSEWALAGRLDLDNIAVIGHSTGGGASVQAAIEDARITSVVGLDAWVEPIAADTLNQGLDVPSVLFRSEAWEISFNNAYLYQLMNVTPSDLNVYQITGTTHYDFGMVYMFSTLSPFIGLQGELGLDMPALQNKLVRSFLDATLKTGPAINYAAYSELTPVVPD